MRKIGTEQQRALSLLPREGEILDGRYRVGHLIGIGGIGVVVAATHTGLDERVAIKFLLPDSMQNPEIVRRFAREGRACNRVRSEHVVRAIDVGVYNELPYLVMERLVGRDLGELLGESGPLPVVTAVDYVLQACEAIAEAHAAGVIHRDLKPSNLFLTHRADGSPCIKVLDFGLSKFVGASDRASGFQTLKTHGDEVIGSPHYMSPEQLQGSATIDERSDVWSLGAILYELLSGRRPFQAPTVVALFSVVLRDPPAPLDDVEPKAVRQIVLRCLAKDPSDRFSDVAALAAALADWGGPNARLSAERIARIVAAAGCVAVRPNRLESAVRSQRAGDVTTRREVMRRRVVPWLALATGLFAFAAGAGWAFAQRTGRPPHPPIFRPVAAAPGAP